MEKMTSDLANDYSEYVQIDMSEELKTVGETIEDILTRLEEFESLLEGVHNGGTSSLIHLGPEIQISCQALNSLFQRVDQIEKLVQNVKKDVNVIETRLDSAEVNSGLPTTDLRSFFKPLFSKKSDPTAFPEVNLPTYEPPDLFRTADYFPASQTGDSSPHDKK